MWSNFLYVFNYNSLFTMDGVNGFMKEVGGSSTLLGPLVQVIRGISIRSSITTI